MLEGRKKASIPQSAGLGLGGPQSPSSDVVQKNSGHFFRHLAKCFNSFRLPFMIASFFCAAPTFHLVLAPVCPPKRTEFFLMHYCDGWIRHGCATTFSGEMLFVSPLAVLRRSTIEPRASPVPICKRQIPSWGTGLVEGLRESRRWRDNPSLKRTIPL